MKKWEHRKHLLKKNRRTLTTCLVGFVALKLFYMTTLAASMMHYWDVLRENYKGMLVPDAVTDQTAREVLGRVTYT